MNGNSPFIQDSSEGLIFFALLMCVIGAITLAFKKSKPWGLAVLIFSGIGGYFFFTDPAAQEYIMAGFALFFFIALAQMLKEKIAG